MQPSSSSGTREIWHVGRDATQRLGQLGLTEAALRRPLEIARADALLCTELDAPGAPWYVFWSRANRYIREHLIPLGWGWSNRDSVLRTVHPEGEFAFTAMSGAGQVGIPDGMPRTKNPKGAAIATIVRYNFAKFGGPRNSQVIPGLEMPEPRFPSDMLPTWFLLYKWTADGIMLELSFPSDMVGSAVNKWREHIVIPRIDFENGPGTDLDVDLFNGPDDSSGVDFPVELVG
jgi:hypothetical protein